jgi:uncharacterized protein YcfJ
MLQAPTTLPQAAIRLLLATSALAWGVSQAQTVPYPVVGAPGTPSSATPTAPPSGEAGRVLQTIPVLQQVAVPRQICTDEQVTVPGQKSGAGAAMGAIAGGAIGNQIGDGSGRAAATVLGILGGVMLGDKIEGNPSASVHTQRRCTTQTVYETRAVAYNVTYEYGGKQYTVQMPQDPGPWVQLQVMPVVPNQPSGYGQPYAPAYPSGYPSPRSEALPYGDAPGTPLGYQPATITQETTYIVPGSTYIAPGAGWYGGTVVRPSIWLDISSGSHRHRHHHGHWR